MRFLFLSCLTVAAASLPGCSDGDAPYLATLQRPPARGDAYPLALAQGRLTVRAGCVAVESPRMPDGRRHVTTLAFPHGYRLQRSDGGWRVLDTLGRERARLGHRFSGGGGEISAFPESPRGWIEERVGKDAVARCPGPWFAVNPTDTEILGR